MERLLSPSLLGFTVAVLVLNQLLVLWIVARLSRGLREVERRAHDLERRLDLQQPRRDDVSAALRLAVKPGPPEGVG